MKKVLGIVFLVVSVPVCVFAQQSRISEFKDIHIDVTFDKRMYLIFPVSVYKFDCSEPDSIIVLKDENKLVIYSKYDEVFDSNLMVETDDGYDYSFIVHWVADIKNPKLIITPDMSFFKRAKARPFQSDGIVGVEVDGVVKKDTAVVELNRTCRLIDGMKADVGLTKLNKKMVFAIGGIYIKEGVLFFRVMVENESNLPFEIDLVSFVQEEEKGKVKRKAVQSPAAMDILYAYNSEVKSIKKGGIYTYIYALKTFTYKKENKLYLEFYEKSNARSVRIELPYTALLKAKQI